MSQDPSSDNAPRRPAPIAIDTFSDYATKDVVTVIRETARVVTEGGLRDLQIDLDTSKIKMKIRARR